MSRHRGPGHDFVVGGWLLARIRPRLPIFWQSQICVPARRHFGAEYRLFLLGLAQCFCHVSAYVRHHYSGAHHRLGGGADEIFGSHGHHRALDVFSLFPVSPYGLGDRRPDEWRLECERQNSRDRFRRRHRRPHVEWMVGFASLSFPRAASRLPQRNHGAAFDGSLHGRDRDALGRLVWI